MLGQAYLLGQLGGQRANPLAVGMNALKNSANAGMSLVKLLQAPTQFNDQHQTALANLFGKQIQNQYAPQGYQDKHDLINAQIQHYMQPANTPINQVNTLYNAYMKETDPQKKAVYQQMLNKLTTHSSLFGNNNIPMTITGPNGEKIIVGGSGSQPQGIGNSNLAAQLQSDSNNLNSIAKGPSYSPSTGQVSMSVNPGNRYGQGRVYNTGNNTGVASLTPTQETYDQASLTGLEKASPYFKDAAKGYAPLATYWGRAKLNAERLFNQMGANFQEPSEVANAKVSLLNGVEGITRAILGRSPPQELLLNTLEKNKMQPGESAEGYAWRLAQQTLMGEKNIGEEAANRLLYGFLLNNPKKTALPNQKQKSLPPKKQTMGQIDYKAIDAELAKRGEL